MRLGRTLIAFIALSFSAATFAVPIYSGDTDAQNMPRRALQSGYTIWNDTGTNSNNWHIRWTSKNQTPARDVDWFGNILFHNSLLDSVETYRFERRGRHRDSWNASFDNASMDLADSFGWVSRTNDRGGVDGFDFVIGEGLEVLQFQLGSSLFNGLDTSAPALARPGEMIFIGDQRLNPDVYVSAVGDRVVQEFQIASVPEPATIALIGIGLFGLGMARRIQKKD